MRLIREFRSNFENIARDCRATVAQLSHDSRATFVRVSYDFPTNVAYFYYHSYDSRATFVRVSLDIYRLSPYLTGMQQLETSSRIFRDKD